MKHQIATILLALTCATTTSCGALQTAATTVGNIDWADALSTVESTYGAIHGALFALCAIEEPGSALDSVCGGIARFDTAAEASLTIAHIAISTGENVSAAVQQAQDQVEILNGAFKELRSAKAKAQVRERAAVRSVQPDVSFPVNPYRATRERAADKALEQAK